jgi:hypothetical protein
VTFSSGGCKKTETTDPGSDKTKTEAKVDAWATAGARLKKETNFSATRQILTSLTNDISHQDGEKLPTFTPESLAALKAIVPLSAGDSEELSGAAYSTHDPAYVADCLYMRDVARSLGVAGLPPEKQAELAFAWVCRQVYLQPWVRNVGTHLEPTVLPPTAVLRRGFGSGIERMYIFLAILQQLELDGCLIGGPNAAKEQSRMGPPIKYPFIPPQIGVPRGPFWAVGVRVGNDVRLFDPWRCEPFPVTLNQLKANPDAAKAWFEDKANTSAATLEDAKKATVYLAVPVNALSPRMALFEAKLKGDLGAKFAYDLKALEAMRAAYPDPKPTFWNPPDDAFSYGRAARTFLPLEHGGGDRSPATGARLYESAQREQIPTSAVRVRADLKADAAILRLAGTAAVMLHGSFIEPPNPRERIQRGQFQDAAKDLVAKQELFSAGLERLRTENAKEQEEAIRQWIDNINRQYAALTVAEIDKRPDAMAAASAEIEAAWKQRPAQLILDQLSAEVGRAEAALLLALCKHEQAEQLQVRLDRTPEANAKHLKLDAWKTALSAWRTYEQISSAHAGFPGRAEHAKMLSARAAKFAQDDAKK